MQFNSYLFILAFLPLTVLIYYVLAKINYKICKYFLIVASAVFYAYLGWQCAVWLIASITLNYLCAIVVKKTVKAKKLLLGIGIAINIAALLYCKYYNFFVENINSIFSSDIAVKELFLPLGISFFTFQQIMYLVEIYRDGNKSNNFFDYLLYILYFPKILMGPITEPESLINQFNAKPELDYYNILKGLTQFSFGLFKKVLIADTFASAVNWAFNNGIGDASSFETLLVMLFYTFEIYFDFSGYSDMAIGVSNMLGIELPMNFDSPYKAVSIRDFWKRWHISLTQFFTKYLYFPLGGSRKGKFRTYLNIMIIFLVSGLWHGASNTFVIWGILNGAICVFDRIFEKFENKLPKILRWILTFSVTNILWLLFRAEFVSQWFGMLKNIVVFKSFYLRPEFLNNFVLPELSLIDTEWIGIVAMILMILAAFLICIIPENNYKRKFNPTIKSMILAVLALVWSIISLSGESAFVYLNF